MHRVLVPQATVVSIGIGNGFRREHIVLKEHVHILPPNMLLAQTIAGPSCLRPPVCAAHGPRELPLLCKVDRRRLKATRQSSPASRAVYWLDPNGAATPAIGPEADVARARRRVRF